MDHQTFDRLTRLVGTSASRRTAWRALLGGALLGATTRGAAAAPTTACTNGAQERCGGECCPGKCFLTCTSLGGPAQEVAFCCTAEHKLIICGTECCLDDGRANPCKNCQAPTGVGVPTGNGEACLEGIAGSYRRRR